MKATSAILCLLSCISTSVVHAAVAPARSSALAGNCTVSVPLPSNTTYPEVKGRSRQGVLWALLFYAPPAMPHLVEKIVLRQTGRGPLRVVGIGPHGRVIHPHWGPERHGGSNWNRPGDEWGTGWLFPTPGCWHLHAQRQHASGNVWLRVVSAS